jgi:hypothetical protein
MCLVAAESVVAQNIHGLLAKRRRSLLAASSAKDAGGKNRVFTISAMASL